MRHAMLREAAEGQALLPVVKHISQSKINAFGVATGSTGAVHVDPEYCGRTPLKTTLAHGFLTMAYVCEMMENNFGMDWATSGELELKFVGAARPGDSVTAGGTIRERKETGRGRAIDCDVSVKNQNGQAVLAGRARLLKTQDDI